MFRNHRPRLLSLSILLAAIGGIAVACSSSPSSPNMTELRITQAKMLLQGASINGTTMPVGHGAGSPIRFEAMLMGPTGPVSGQNVLVRVQQPMGVMGGIREFHLYDDGTHGDDHAGDGEYCFEDVEFEYGCNGAGMGAGTYHYEFFGVDHEGHHTNHMQVSVTLQ